MYMTAMNTTNLTFYKKYFSEIQHIFHSCEINCDDVFIWVANEWSPRIYLDHNHKNFHSRILQ